VTLSVLSIDFPIAAPDECEQAFIASATRRAQDFIRRNPNVTTLLGSDPLAFCSGLHALRRLDLLSGRNFCDWGSGIGTIAGLAALNGFDAYGIEIEPAFVAEARELCSELGVPVRFACGSFICREIADQFAVTGTYGATDWRISPGQDDYSVLGTHVWEMDLIYAYPWPRELSLYEELFDLTAHGGAVLWLYRQREPPRILVKD